MVDQKGRVAAGCGFVLLLAASCGGQTQSSATSAETGSGGTPSERSLPAAGGTRDASGSVETAGLPGGAQVVGPGEGGQGGADGTSRCGNGIFESEVDEECDDGNRLSGDGCSATCRLEDWDPCVPSGCRPTVVCGDGSLAASERCDDGNANSGDGCTGDCRAVEPGFYCPTPGDPCQRLPALPSCGNGIVEPELGESCDDGPNNGIHGGCGAACLFAAYCGDGVVQPEFEQCDQGSDNTGSYGGCTPDCRLGPYCGDGVVQMEGGEACDQGPENVPSDAADSAYGRCLETCRLGPYCGDGIVQSAFGEQCDGQTGATCGCNSTCRANLLVCE